MRIAPTLCFLAMLTACTRSEPESPVAVQASSAAAAPADSPVPAATANCEFCADPAFVRTCEVAGGVRTTLYWNISDPAIRHIGIFVVDDAGNDSSFAEKPSKGSVQTGPWLKPGLTFKLKDPAGRVLKSLVIEGRDCEPGS